MPKKIILFITLMLTALAPTQVRAAPLADVQADSVSFDFPNTATFSASLSASSEIVAVVLEYGAEQLTCGEVVAKAFPQFSPSASLNVSWTWDMRQSGSLPPGAKIWWRWHYTDSSGKEYVGDKNEATWLDDVHAWQTVSNSQLSIHYYDKEKSFAQELLAAGTDGLKRNKEQAGMVSDIPIDFYVYPNYDDMRDAILYEPAWTGGQAQPEYGIAIMGLSGFDETWDKNTVVHELTHILVGRSAFSCLGSRPGWLEEGLAMYSEGKLDSGMQSMLDQAARSNSLITLRSLNGGFSENPDKANLSYAQSYSVVKFLIESYGQEKMSVFLKALSDAKAIDEALREAYGLDTEGVDAAWRASIGAPALTVAQATAQPTPTWVPTYVPIDGIPQAITATPNAVPTSNPNPPGSENNPQTVNPQENSKSTLSALTMGMLVAVCCLCLVLLAIIGAIWFFVRKNKSKGGGNG
ncbi:MAG: hypothetical protein LC099_11280 [Anaerolineales bacterium]|nr:hypothetical protein [Anaerolineales bacterium]